MKKIGLAVALIYLLTMGIVNASCINTGPCNDSDHHREPMYFGLFVGTVLLGAMSYVVYKGIRGSAKKSMQISKLKMLPGLEIKEDSQNQLSLTLVWSY